MNTRRFSRTLCAFVTFAAMGLVADIATASATRTVAGVGVARVIGAKTVLPSGDRSLGRLAPNTTLQLNVSLAPSDASQLDTYARTVTDRSSSDYRRYINTTTFAQRYGASPTEMTKVRGYLVKRGLIFGGVTRNHLIMQMSGTARKISKIFKTKIDRVQVPGETTGFANISSIVAPREIATDLLSVTGLDGLSSLKPAGLVAAKTAVAPSGGPTPLTTGPSPVGSCAASITDSGGLSVNQLANAYGFNNLYPSDVGSGQTVALIEFAPYLQSDVAAFASCYGLSNPKFSYCTVTTDQPLCSTSTPLGATEAGVDGELEADLDVEAVLGLAPDADVIAYQSTGADDNTVLDTYNAAISNSAVDVISTSWGECETDADSALTLGEAPLFEEAVTEGKTVVAASGDSGSTDCGLTDGRAVDDPASQPDVTGVGGTMFASLTDPTSQSAWSQLALDLQIQNETGTFTITWGDLTTGSMASNISTTMLADDLNDIRPAGDSVSLSGSSLSSTTGVTIQIVPSSPAAVPVPMNLNATGLVVSGGGTSVATLTNDSIGGGGGVSSLWAMPSYQADAPPSLNIVSSASTCTNGQIAGNCREVPDVSSDAGTPFSVYCAVCSDANWIAVEGTSLAAPTWGSLIALANSSQACAGSNLGFINPALYSIAASSAARDALSDIVTGSDAINITSYAFNPDAYAAGSGYDMATGLGTPIAGTGEGGDQGLVTQLCQAPRVTTSTTTSTTTTTPTAPITTPTAPITTPTVPITTSPTVPITTSPTVPPATTSPATSTTQSTTATRTLPASAVNDSSKVASSTSKVTVSRSVVSVVISCRTKTCRGTVSLVERVRKLVRKNHRNVVTYLEKPLAASRYTLSPSKQQTVKLTLNALGKNVLARVSTKSLTERLLISVSGGSTYSHNITVV
jgi:subtilase family serine protease